MGQGPLTIQSQKDSVSRMSNRGRLLPSKAEERYREMRIHSLSSMSMALTLSLLISACGGHFQKDLNRAFSSKQVFDLVKDYASGYCNRFPGRSSVAEMGVKIKGDTGFLDLLTDIGIEIDAEITARLTRTLDGFPRHIANSVVGSQNCSLQAVGITTRLLQPVHDQGSEVAELSTDHFVKQISLALDGLDSYDVDDVLIETIPRIPGTLDCRDLRKMLTNADKYDVDDVVKVVAPYIRKPTYAQCYRDISLLADKYDRDKVLRILASSEYQ